MIVLILYLQQEAGICLVYKKAKEKALNNGQNYHLAAILWRGKTPLQIRSNTLKTHPRFTRIYKDGTQGNCMHAEMNVLRFAKPGDVIEVLRFKKSGGRAMAKPCRYCMQHIRHAGISKVRYTDEDGGWKTIRIKQ